MTDNLIGIIEQSLSLIAAVPIRVYSWKPQGGGCINNASVLETDMGPLFVKWNSDCNPNMFLREAESLNELRQASNGILQVPKVVFAKKVDNTPGMLMLEYLSSGYTRYDDEILGRGLATIHAHRSSGFGFYHTNYCGATEQNNTWKDNWVQFFVENRIHYLLQLIYRKKMFSVSDMKIYEKLLERIPDLLSNSSVPVLIHGDLWSGNYMNTVNGPALIDPASYYAEREMEFAIITMFGGFSTRFFDAYNEVNPLETDWKSRNQLYQLYHVLNHYYLFGGSYGQQALSIAKKYI